MRRSPATCLGIVSTALLLAACGSTVQSVASGTRGNGTDGLALPQSAASGPGNGGALGPGGSLVPGGARGATQPAATGPGAATAGSGAGSGGGGAGVQPGSTLGITPTTISIGIEYVTGADAADRALGGSNATNGDSKADAQAVVDDINAHGGVAGRRLVPVWYEFQETDTRPYAVIDNDMCATFTQDHHVFAAIGDGLTDDYPACVSKAGALIVSDASTIIGPDQDFFNRFRYLFNVGYLTQERMMAAEVRSLVRQSYFGGWNAALGQPASTSAKVGIITYDTPNWNVPLEHVMLPALASAGHPVDKANIERVTYPSDTNQVAGAVAGIQGAVLKFRQNGVTHVIVLDGNGSMTLHMLNTMRSQRYYPRLGINSATGVETLFDTYHESAQSFNGAVGFGWSPTLDLPAAEANKHLTRSGKACISMVQKRSGQNFGGSANAAAIALGYCTEIYLVADAINSAGSVISRANAAAAIESLGFRYPSPDTPDLFFSPARHDGVEYGFDMRFDNACTCVKYTSPSYRIP